MNVLVAIGVAALYSTGFLAAAGKPVTITGCVRAGATPDSFGLWNVEEISAGSAVPAGAVYRLSSTAGLTNHVGHKVEVRGTYVLTIDREKRTKINDSSRASIDRESRHIGTSGSAAELVSPYRHLTVHSIRLIAASCQ
jgi:hypothetical protein